MNNSKFKELISLVNEFVEGYTNMEETAIQQRIQSAYEDDEIDGVQYDYLNNLLT